MTEIRFNKIAKPITLTLDDPTKIAKFERGTHCPLCLTPFSKDGHCDRCYPDGPVNPERPPTIVVTGIADSDYIFTEDSER